MYQTALTTVIKKEFKVNTLPGFFGYLQEQNKKGALSQAIFTRTKKWKKILFQLTLPHTKEVDAFLNLRIKILILCTERKLRMKAGKKVYSA